MKALVLAGPNDLRLEDRPLPTPGRGQVRLRPIAVGICGTDLHIVDGSFPSRPPLVLGHEVAGLVYGVGAGVDGIVDGDLVCIEPHEYCGMCRYCRTGREHLCVRKEAYGVHLDGGMQEALVVSARTVYRVPTGVSPTVAAMAEPVACCIHAIDRLSPVSGFSGLIFGAGAAGCILIALLRLAGLAHIVVVEPDPDRRDRALQFGAKAAIDPGSEGWQSAVAADAQGDGFDFVVDAVGSPAILQQAIAMAARGGRILVFGVARSDAEATVSPYEIYSRELTIIGTAINPYTHHRAVEMLSELELDRLGFETFSLARYADAFAATRAGTTGKVQLDPRSP